MTPGEQRLDELIVSFAAIEPVLNDFARARVAARLRREIEELEAKEAAEYGEWSTARVEPRGSGEVEEVGGDEGLEGEKLGESWRTFDCDGLAEVRRGEEDHAGASDADRRAEQEAEARRQAARHRRMRWAALASSAVAAGALLGWLHSMRGEEGETTLLVSVLPVQLDPPSVPLVPGDRTAEGGEVERSEEGEEAMDLSAKASAATARSARGHGAVPRPPAGTSRAAPRMQGEVATVSVPLADEEEPRYLVRRSEPPASGPGELARSAIVTELAGISERAAAAADQPPPADEPTEYLRCSAAMARGEHAALGCLASFRGRFPSSIYDSDALAALAVATAEAERCGEAMPLLDEYLARYPDRGKARQISRLRDSCEQRVRVQAP